MLFSLSIIFIFVGVSIYFYFKAEKLRVELISLKKEVKNFKQESKIMSDSLAVIAKKNEEFITHRFRKIQEKEKEKQKGNELVKLLTPLVTNYAAIFRESIRGKGMMHKIAQKCCESYQKGSYKHLTQHIAKQEAHIKRAWGSNNINGFVSFLEAMIIELDKPQDTDTKN
ncbi:hypothetical protein AADZ91_03360 [Colwelliaceae bacterium 6441]